jgi:hypothetical protein
MEEAMASAAATVKREREVVSVQAKTEGTLQLGLAPVGRLASQTRMAQDPSTMGTVGVDEYIDLPRESAPAIGEVVEVTYTRKAQ